MPEPFDAFVVTKTDDTFTAGLRQLSLADLPPGEVTIRVEYSSVNYKDGLASIADGRVARVYPLVPGIDMAGVVEASQDARFRPGDAVIAQSFDIGVARHGGFAGYARVPADWTFPLPDGLTAREAMALGTAGFTAALSIVMLEERGLRPERGPVLVSGATGGVGSVAVSMLARLGYQVVGSTGKAAEHEYLRSLGAGEILSREEASAKSDRPLDRERWAACIDPVGGDTLAYMLRTTKYGGAIVSSGLTGGSALQTTVFPFILRALSLFGVDSALTPIPLRQRVWGRMATDMKPEQLSDSIAREVSLDTLPGALVAILRGEVRGRTVVLLRP